MINLFKKKDKKEKLTKKQKELIEDYEKGRILQIDNETDNKKYFEGKK